MAPVTRIGCGKRLNHHQRSLIYRQGHVFISGLQQRCAFITENPPEIALRCGAERIGVEEPGGPAESHVLILSRRRVLAGDSEATGKLAVIGHKRSAVALIIRVIGGEALPDTLGCGSDSATLQASSRVSQ